ncbi:efflux RND transporter permease subunit [Pedomonas sp. V897]|uniref:efflux RND transporter permease subunit n=1 Tax=Pedomonas sp. V897 TaxID=3446482 RepID=UPI003EDF466A
MSNFGKFFIDRPIFAAVLSLMIVIVGIVAYVSLPIAQYPDIAPPTITVTASYPGATPETIAETVATPIEQEVNGVENMLYMYSQATSDGQMTLTISFAPGTNLDTAQVLVQNRVAVAEPRLPEEVRRLGVVTQKNAPDIMMAVHLRSPDKSRDQIYISNYVILQVQDALRRVDGVGNVRISGVREYSMRVWLDPDRIAALGMTPDEVVAALRAQNVQVAGGALGAPPVNTNTAFRVNLTLQGRFTSPEQFENVIIRTGEDGRFTRLKDVARVELGAADYSTLSYLNGEPAIGMLLSQRPGANALATAERVKATMEELSRSFPPGLEYRIVYNPTEFIRQSVDSVFHTIFEAIILVIVVVVLFLQTWRASIIPILTIPVSLIGTFAVMKAMGQSLNNLSLLGLVLAVGIVVDDAIVVVENVERNLRNGLSPREAARKTMEEVGGALISIALVLCAVFIPAMFLSGVSGAFYRQFALTIAVATVISAFNSFTLSPALSALLLKAHKSGKHDAHGHGGRRSPVGALTERFANWFNTAFDRMSDRYGALSGRMVKRPLLWLGVYVVLIGLTAFMFIRVPGGFIPEQDQGYLIAAYQLPPGASLERTDAVARKVEKIALATEGVRAVISIPGFSGITRTNTTSAGVTFVPLQPYEKRNGRTSFEILAELRQKMAAIDEGTVSVLNPPAVPSLGTSAGFAMRLEDRAGVGEKALADATMAMMAAAKESPKIAYALSPFDIRAPQMHVEVDRTKAEILRVPVQNIFSALEIYLGSAYVNDFTVKGRIFRVRAQADAPHRLTPDDIARIRTRSETGAMVPLGSLVTVKTATGPDRFPRYNLYPAAELIGAAAPGVSTGQAMQELEAIAAKILPPGISYEWTDMSYQEKNAGNTAIFVFPLSVLFVFLVLAANYESWAMPMAIILIVPMCLLSAIGGIMMRGMDNNILTQIGFIVLIALAAKNAILIVEFARDLEAQGRSMVEAAVEAARLRLRPILMTSLAFILGVVPLVLAKGAGAEMRQSLGTAVFFGMLGVTLFGLLFTPVFYVLIRRLTERRSRRSQKSTPLVTEPAE